jgi:predicted permease
VPLHDDHVAAIRPTLLLMQAGALCLLLIGAVNLVNLLLIRASIRVKELAVRQALGASRRHILSAVMMETSVLTLVGGICGLVVGAGGIRLLAVLGADRLPLGAHIAFDARLGLVTLVGSIVLGIATGAPVAWYYLRGHSANALQSESRSGTASRAVQRLRYGFLVAQIALAFVLLAGAGLLRLSLEQVMSVSPGFRPQNTLSGRISLPSKDYRNGLAIFAFTERLRDALDHQPGVLAVGVVTNLPFSGYSGKSAATLKDHALQRGESVRGYYSYGVGGDYFTALGSSLREGRFLVASDSERRARVCVVDEDFARRYWPHGGAIGQRLFQGSGQENDVDAFTIVGVVGAVKQAGLTEDDAQGAIYYPFSYRLDNTFFVVTRTSVPQESFGITLEHVVRAIDPELPVNDIRSMEARIGDSLVDRRSPALLAGLFSVIAVLLTAIGTYGVLSYAVAQRRREIGLRLALGARPGQVGGQFACLALRLLAAGTVCGVIGASLTGRAMQTILFHVPALHVPTLAATAAIVGMVSMIACLLPARRAAYVSPIETLAEQ